MIPRRPIAMPERKYFEFTDVVLEFDSSRGCATAKLAEGIGCRGLDARTESRFSVVDAYIVAGAWIASCDSAWTAVPWTQRR
jgi:hypothetical protein